MSEAVFKIVYGVIIDFIHYGLYAVLLWLVADNIDIAVTFYQCWMASIVIMFPHILYKKD
jgi:hypothetical protein